MLFYLTKNSVCDSIVNNMKCPDCGYLKMAKYGHTWSGRRRVQKYRCIKCGRTKIDTKGKK